MSRRAAFAGQIALARAMVTVAGAAPRPGLLAAGLGMLQFTGHLGHWELAALMQGHLDMALSVVARPLDNPGLERLLTALRTGSGNTVVHKHSALREMLRMVLLGGAVAIVIDQDARDQGVFVPFFGRPASTTRSLALLALRTGAPVIPAFCVPLDDRTYRLVYEPPMKIERTGDRETDVLRLTVACTSVIERWVRREPHLWLWMHRRWKTQPTSR